ncbi:chromosome partitioning protein [Azospirillum oryzae]|uniref:Chromosome partitioning protein n=1 Tax=Azospirillum oryzae TaxID=286727 RepID=A0A1X7FN76_9PROT|nr:ParA family protein [Azospirillum oryzae]SMF55465.1 chromosome partitioning protein [Azospirillum oryzae]
MKIIAVVSPKGGSGKSTLTRNLAAAAAGDGVPVAVIDTDAQGTSAEWARVRADADAVPVPGFTAETSAAARRADAAGAQLVLVDTPTAIEKDPEGFKALVLASELVVIPTQALPDDVRSVETIMRAVQALDRPAIYCLNRVKPRVKETDGARLRLIRSGDVAAAAIPDSVDVVRAMANGYGVTEVGGRGADEVAALWQEVRRRIGL